MEERVSNLLSMRMPYLIGFFFNRNSSRDSNKTNPTLVKNPSNGHSLEETPQTGQAQVKLMPILEGGENEDKVNEQPTRLPKEMSLTTTTLEWTPNE